MGLCRLPTFQPGPIWQNFKERHVSVRLNILNIQKELVEIKKETVATFNIFDKILLNLFFATRKENVTFLFIKMFENNAAQRLNKYII